MPDLIGHPEPNRRSCTVDQAAKALGKAINGHIRYPQAMRDRAPAVYILASKRNGTLYVGCTSNLPKRIWEHRNRVVPGFTTRYSVHRLVYVEAHDDMLNAVTREKRLKRWPRAWKIALIEQQNPEWCDLWEAIGG